MRLNMRSLLYVTELSQAMALRYHVENSMLSRLDSMSEPFGSMSEPFGR